LSSVPRQPLSSRQHLLTGVLAEEVANEIGIHTFSLYRWKKELRDAGLQLL